MIADKYMMKDYIGFHHQKYTFSQSGRAGLLWWWCVHSLLDPVGMRWIVVLLVGVRTLLEPVRKSWTSVVMVDTELG